MSDEENKESATIRHTQFTDWVYRDPDWYDEFWRKHGPPNGPVSYLCWRMEHGEDGNEDDPSSWHGQGYIQFRYPIRVKWFTDNFLGVHTERPKRSAVTNRNYCTSDDKPGKIAGPWEYGTAQYQGKRTDIFELQDAIEKGIFRVVCITPAAGFL